MYVLLAAMGFCLYRTMKQNPGYVPLNSDLTAAKRVCTVYVRKHTCVFVVMVSFMFVTTYVHVLWYCPCFAHTNY